MPDSVALALAWLAGVLLGAAFFGGLWWTVTRGLRSPRPALWFGASLLLRVALVLAGFAWLAAGDWRRLLLGLLGFMMARVAVSRLVVRASHALPAAGGPPCA